MGGGVEQCRGCERINRSVGYSNGAAQEGINGNKGYCMRVVDDGVNESAILGDCLLNEAIDEAGLKKKIPTSMSGARKFVMSALNKARSQTNISGDSHIPRMIDDGIIPVVFATSVALTRKKGKKAVVNETDSSRAL